MGTTANINYYGVNLCVSHDGHPETVIDEFLMDMRNTLKEYKEKTLTFEEALALTLHKHVPSPPNPYQFAVRSSFTSPNFSYTVDDEGVSVCSRTIQFYSWEELEEHGSYEKASRDSEKLLKNSLKSIFQRIKDDDFEDMEYSNFLDKLLKMAEDITKDAPCFNGYQLDEEELEDLYLSLESVILDSHESMDTNVGMLNAMNTYTE